MPILTTSPDARGRGNNPAPASRRRLHGLFFGLSLTLGALLTVGSAVFGWWRYGVESSSVWSRVRFSDAGFVVDADGRSWEWTEQRRTATTWYRLWNSPSVVRIDAFPLTQEENSKDLVNRYGSPRECRAWKSLVEQKRYLWNFAAIDRIDVGWPARSFTLLNAWRAENPRITGNKLWQGTDLQSATMPDWIESLQLSRKLGTAYLPTSPLLPGVLISWGVLVGCGGLCSGVPDGLPTRACGPSSSKWAVYHVRVCPAGPCRGNVPGVWRGWGAGLGWWGCLCCTLKPPVWRANFMHMCGLPCGGEPPGGGFA